MGLTYRRHIWCFKNVAWTNEGAEVDIDELPSKALEARLAGRSLSVECVDKFPKMVDYVVPSGIRIADTSRVRLGAYVGEGTTVMHEGFINFNAGTEGPNMIEGVSAGVFCGAGSDVGGGASINGNPLWRWQYGYLPWRKVLTRCQFRCWNSSR